jgi:hypothetical protein
MTARVVGVNDEELVADDDLVHWQLEKYEEQKQEGTHSAHFTRLKTDAQ